MFFCERFCTDCCILLTNFKKPTILGKIVDFFKIIGEIQQLVRKRLQKTSFDVFFFKKWPHLNAVGNTKNKKMNPSPRKIGLICVTNSQAVAHNSWMARCSTYNRIYFQDQYFLLYMQPHFVTCHHTLESEAAF